MKTLLLVGITALTLSGSVQALAQATPMFTPEQRTVIKEYVVQERVAPLSGVNISVGTRLPADVELRAVPSAWGPGIAQYRYVYADNRIYFVNPSTREVLSVID